MEEGKDNGFDTKMVDLEEFDPEVLKGTKLCLFLMATYGEGEPTDNSARFVKWLKNEDGDVPDNFLSEVQFSVFGLGNKQYEHFNRMGKITNSLLEKLGARRIYPYGQGDDDGTLEEDFEAWKSKLWSSLQEQFISSSAAEASARSTNSEITSHKVSLHFQLNPIAAKVATANIPDTKMIHNSNRHFFTAPRVPVVVNRELRNLTGKDQGSTRHIDFDLSACGVHYETADNLAILPENPNELVKAVADALKYDVDQVVSMEAIEGEDFKFVYPTPCTIRELLACYIDLQGELKQGVLRALLYYVSDPEQRAWLERMLHNEHRAELKNILRLRSFASLLANELSSLQIPLVDLLHILPPIQPRYYTISSSALAHPKVVSITVSLTQGTAANGTPFTGLCSGYLCDLVPGKHTTKVFVRASTFRLPASLSTPLILIGPGTGFAPMHAFLQERKYLLDAKPELRAQAGPIALFFGCRHSNVDWIYQEEVKSLVDEGVITFLQLAFSRDSQASHDGCDSSEDARIVAKSKVYVQQLLQQPSMARRLLDWLKIGSDGRPSDAGGAHVYVCGATNMGHDVMGALQNVLTQGGCVDSSAAIKSLQDSGRYVQELWSA